MLSSNLNLYLIVFSNLYYVISEVANECMAVFCLIHFYHCMEEDSFRVL